jgi:hypothetical protein
MTKIILRYVGGALGEPKKGQIFGGTMATNYAIKMAFKDSELFDLQMKMRTDFTTPEEVKQYLDGGDVSWTDDTSVLERHFEAGYDRPDLIGPISRSPVKRYGGNWVAKYPASYFYNGPVIRLNESEEKQSTLLPKFINDFVSKISFIRHGIDLESMTTKKAERIYILWAGQKARPAKNYPMWGEIQKIINDGGGLPKPYEFKTMSGYVVDDYWDTLDETALLVNTSLYESFCCAVAEGRAKGVGALVRENFNGKFMHLNQPGQTRYTAEDYVLKIVELCNDREKMEKLQQDSLTYVEFNCGLNAMREDIEEVLLDIIDNKNG